MTVEEIGWDVRVGTWRNCSSRRMVGVIHSSREILASVHNQGN